MKALKNEMASAKSIGASLPAEAHSPPRSRGAGSGLEADRAPIRLL
ncbi:MAG: hypothetical protein R3E39_14980 [Anaerolineae bacterium]